MASDAATAAAPPRTEAPPAPASSSPSSLPRHDRAAAMSFVTDAATETALRDGLAEDLPEGLDTHRGDLGAAIATLQKIASPQILIVDISGEDQPLSALGRLAMCVEPDTCVLVVGDVRDLGLYRELTRGLGVGEYLPKPVTRDMVGRHFAPLVRGQWPEAERQTGGRLITITGARGGVGASAIAASLAWYFGMTARRHTMLLDADLHRGTAALLLDAEPGEGLRIALEAPERIDALLAERVAHPVADRLHVLSTLEPPTRDIEYVPGAADNLLAALCRRYNCVVADVPWVAAPFCRDLYASSHHRVLVLTPTLPAIRDTAAHADPARPRHLQAVHRRRAQPRRDARRPQARRRCRKRCGCRSTSPSPTCPARSPAPSPWASRRRCAPAPSAAASSSWRARSGRCGSTTRRRPPPPDAPARPACSPLSGPARRRNST